MQRIIIYFLLLYLFAPNKASEISYDAHLNTLLQQLKEKMACKNFLETLPLFTELTIVDVAPILTLSEPVQKQLFLLLKQKSALQAFNQINGEIIGLKWILRSMIKNNSTKSREFIVKMDIS